MSRVFEALCAHLKTHPEAEVQDAVKFLYQASFGGGHFLSDPDGAYLYLLKEAEIANLDAPYTEALGEQYARINLSALQELSPKTLFAMFKASSEDTPTDKTAFLSLLDELENADLFDQIRKRGVFEIVPRGGLPFRAPQRSVPPCVSPGIPRGEKSVCGFSAGIHRDQ